MSTRYWLCCGALCPLHSDKPRMAPDCLDKTKARYGTPDEHSEFQIVFSLRERARFEHEHPFLDLSTEVDPWGPIPRYLNERTKNAFRDWASYQ